ncbi:hypothetical protein PV325_000872 [Microctonus aethiopoides]|uniref:Uncharacterized protein n=1 Tax=Microctonus aethiopoides TaxID=144406 RepID=A0AA39F9Z5_9HYME|nr:hypothetical protein PV325_000872 [Microctonus aethiopoides]KAK0165628.1 hypothetical protein PV328_004130 [Microctonus aethiopoides]
MSDPIWWSKFLFRNRSETSEKVPEQYGCSECRCCACFFKNTAENNYIAAENIVRQRRDNVATSMDNEGRSGAAEKRNETNGPVEEAQGRRGLRQTSWKAQLPVDHADPIDRRIFVASLDKIIWWR